ncbi:MAG: hypothetical protein IJK04_13490, partial [Kiritimatiellae bacterium]|nr:hypothetical protein [Kiritimatiellia bacterium]
MEKVATALLLSIAFGLPALAFFPPSDSRDGVSARFVGFDETGGKSAFVPAKRAAGEPFEIRLDIANATGAPVSGEFAIWLGDDWDLALPGEAQDRGSARPDEEHRDAQALPCAIPAHSTNSFFATAVPRPGRVLPALYPVHASFAFPGGEPLHPIAIFEAVKGEADSSPPSFHGGLDSPVRLAL